MLSLDYSQIDLLLERPMAWCLRYQQGIEPPLASPLFLGGTFHLTYATYYDQKLSGTIMTRADVEDCFAMLFDNRLSAGDNAILWKQEPEAERNMGLALVRAYYPIATKTEPLMVEKRFSTTLSVDDEEVEIFGTLDLVTTDGVPVDLKTSAHLPVQRTIDKLLQPTVYGIILKAEELPLFLFHYAIKAKVPYARVLRTKRDSSYISWVRDTVIPGAVRMIKNGVFLCHPEHCSGTWCDYAGMGLCGW